jgi:hypothetical protein
MNVRVASRLEPTDLAAKAVPPQAAVDAPQPMPNLWNQSAGRKSARLSKKQWAGLVAASALVLVVLVALKLKSQQTHVRFHANVEGARFSADGKPVDGDSILLRTGKEHRVEASREGYEPATQKIVPGQSAQSVEFRLTPLPPQLRVSANLPAGSVLLGEQGPVPLESGEFNVQSVPAGIPILKVYDGSRRSLEIPLRVEEGKPIVLNGPITAQDCSAVLISVNGTRATIYASSNVKGSVGKLPQQAISPDGMQIDMTGPSEEFTFDNGQIVPFHSTSRPSLIVSMNVQTPRTDAIPDKGRAFLRMLSVEPEAEVYIDGEHWGKITATGFLETAVKAGTHRIILTKSQYEDSQPLLVRVQPGQIEQILGRQIPLIKQGSLVFNIFPASATVHYEMKTGRARHQSGTARANDTIFLRPGPYTVDIEAPGYLGVARVVPITSGQRADLKLTLTAGSANPAPHDEPSSKAKPLFADMSLWSKQNDWWTLKDVTYGWLNANRGVFSVSVKKQFKGILAKSAKRVEWNIDYRGDGDRVIYWIDENVLHRRALKGGQTIWGDSNITLSARPGDVYRFIFDVSPFRIAVSDETGRNLDEFNRPNANVPLGKLGFLGPISLSVEQTR